MTEETPKIPTLYDKNPAAWEAIIQSGNPNLGALSKKMFTAAQMDRALGMANSAGRWHNRLASPTLDMDGRAAEFLSNGYIPLQPKSKAIPDLVSKPVDVEAPQPSGQGKASVGTVLVVTVPQASKVAGVIKLLKTIGCDVIET